MTDLLITFTILLVLLFALLFRLQYVKTGNDEFFDLENTTAMRGFWCVVVMFVHIPVAYQNRLQDMIGSFAYIGVTFFFMTSAFGLTRSYIKNKGMIKMFWKKRLPKLLLPNWIINLLFVVVTFLLFQEKITLLRIVSINNWVRILLLCYLLFYLVNYFIDSKFNPLILSGIIAITSLTLFFLCHKQIITFGTWSVEMYGFIWGILFAVNYEKIKNFLQRKWKLKTTLFMISSLVLGGGYLKYKYVFVLGDYLLRIILGITILIFILSLNRRFRIGNNIINKLGSISYEVYLIHGFTYYVLSKLLPHISSGIFILYSFFLTIFVSGLVHILVIGMQKKIVKKVIKI